MLSSSGWRSRLTESVIKKTTEAYLKSETIPSLTSAHISKSDDFIEINSFWSQPSAVAGKNVPFSRSFAISKDFSKTFVQSTVKPYESTESIVAYWGNQSTNQIVIYKSKNPKGEDMFILERWTSDGLEKSYNLTDLDLHGPVYFDSEFGSLVVNKSGTKLAYIAEEKRPKSVPFFKKNASAKNEPTNEERGTEFCYVEEWGEQLVGKSQSVIVTLNLAEDTFKVWSRENVLPADVCPGELSWLNDDSLVGVATRTEPRRLGVIYCTNRPSLVFQLSVSDVDDQDQQRYKEIPSSSSGKNCKSPSVNPDESQLIWLERDLADNFPGPHGACFNLVALDLSDQEANPRTVVPVVQHHELGDLSFSGIYGPLSERCFLSSHEIIFTTPIVDTPYPVIINIQSGEITVLKNHPHLTIKDVSDDFIVGVLSTPTKPFSIVFAKYDEGSKDLELISTGKSSTNSPLVEGFVWKSLIHTPKAGHPNPAFAKVKFSSVFIGPEQGEPGSIPLILLPHGGPHSMLPASFSREINFFNRMGFGVLYVNFRGSLGVGQDSVDSLLGLVGDTDVKDCVQALEDCLKEFPHVNADKVVLFGGSHGGFLVTHLAGQYPETFKAVVARNPVVNISSMANVSDIPDWCMNEAGLKYEYGSPNPDVLKSMFEKSPIAHASKVTAPVFLMVGKNDLRVPPSQSYEFYNTLKSLGKEVYMNVYDDNHPLAKIPTTSNVFVNVVLFFDSVLNREKS